MPHQNDHFTEQQVKEIVDLLFSRKYTDTQIAERYGKKRQAITYIRTGRTYKKFTQGVVRELKKLGRVDTVRKVLNQNQVMEIIQLLFSRELTDLDIAKEMGVGRKTIYGIKRGLNYYHWTEPYLDDLLALPRTTRKVSPTVANEIREKYFSGDMTQKSLCDEYGVNKTHMSNIISKKYY